MNNRDPRADNGVKFSSTYQPKKNGRKPKLYKELTAMIGGKGTNCEVTLSKDDFNHLQIWLLERNPVELRNIAGNPKTPAWLVSVASALADDVKRGRMLTLEKVFDRVFGKPQINADITSGNEPLQANRLDLSGLSDAELAVIGKIILKPETSANEQPGD